VHPITPIENRYQLGQVLGSGGMSTVYSAVDLQTGTKVAVKVLNVTMRSSPEALRRLRREVAVLKSLNSPHIAGFLAAGEHADGSPYIVMEYLDGHDLRLELRRRGRIPIEEACAYVAQACRGIAVAHAQHVVHRDIKPSNLVLVKSDTRRTLKVVDFGVAKILSHADLSQTPSSDSVVGTPLYMAPEQLLRHAEPSHRSDLWSLGAVCYELISGVSPFADDSLGRIVAAVALDDPTPIQQLVPELPHALGDLIAQLLRKDPAERPGSAEEVLNRLAPFCLDDSALHVAEELLAPARLIAPPKRNKHAMPWARQPQRVPATQEPRDEPITIRRSVRIHDRLASMRPAGSAIGDAQTVLLPAEEDDGEPSPPSR
jgi:serine/threonine-protein kinase